MLLVQQIRETIRRHGMFRPGDRIAVAVSGGADSVALLLLLDELKAELGVTLLVAHFNHGLRGAESDGDEQFVVDLAARLGLEFLSAREDVAAAARKAGRNLEEAARQLRYAYFTRLVESAHVSRVAVAHTADDQAETVLAHLLRGTGPTGLAGIYPVAGHVVRPLLDVRRADLREYLAARGQTWREDSTNLDTSRLRARIRHRLLPVLDTEFGPAVVEHLASLATLARGDEEAWRLILDAAVAAKVQKTGSGLRVHVASFQAPEGLQRRLVRRLVEELAGHRRRLTAHHVEQVLRLADQQPAGSEVQLPGGIVVRRSLDAHLVFSLALEETAAGADGYEYVLELSPRRDASIAIPQLGKRFTAKVIDWSGRASETKDGAQALDFDRLAAPLVLRNWRPGDAYRPRGQRKAHKLKRLFWEQGIDSWQRPLWPVLTSAGRIVWARGLPAADEAAPREGTLSGVVIGEEEL